MFKVKPINSKTIMVISWIDLNKDTNSDILVKTNICERLTGWNYPFNNDNIMHIPRLMFKSNYREDKGWESETRWMEWKK